MKILLTSTSFQDTPGKHHLILEQTDFEIDKLRGPLPEDELLKVIHKYDGIICSDDEYTEEVIKKGSQNRLKVISKYGVGLDSINLDAAKKHNIKVTNCLNVNHITVSEHVFALLLTFQRNIHHEYNASIKGGWIRTIGNDLYGKHIGIIGLGRIGKEVAKKALAFGMQVSAFELQPDESFLKKYPVKMIRDLGEMFETSDIICLHLPLNLITEKIVTSDLILKHSKPGLILINTSRAKLIDLDALITGLEDNKIGGYLTDVSEVEPIKKDHPLIGMNNVIITSHIGSRTYETVERQGIMAVENLVSVLNP